MPIVVSYAGVDGDVVRSLITAGKAQGLVVARLGGSPKRIPVVITGAPYGTYAPDLRIARIGYHDEGNRLGIADYLSAQKARILLMLAMLETREAIALQAHFDR